MVLGHVVIGGGTGFIGSCIANALKQEGANVTIISRMPGPSRLTWTQLSREGLPKDTTAVINVAGQNILDPTRRWTTGFRQNVWNSRVETTKALSRAITFADVKKFVSISGVAYYPPNGKEYTEDDKCEPYDYLSELCHAWEAAAKLPDDCKTKQVTIRSGVVLGRTGGMIAQTFLPFYLGLGGPLGFPVNGPLLREFSVQH